MRDLVLYCRPNHGKKMATPGELHNLHNHNKKIPGETKTSIGREYYAIINGLSHYESQQQLTYSQVSY